MLQLKNIKIVLKKDGRFLADGFSFTLEKGDRAVIIGEEGNGKSTLLRFIYDPGSTDSYCETEGEVITDCKMAYLPQVKEISAKLWRSILRARSTTGIRRF